MRMLAFGAMIDRWMIVGEAEGDPVELPGAAAVVVEVVVMVVVVVVVVPVELVWRVGRDEAK